MSIQEVVQDIMTTAPAYLTEGQMAFLRKIGEEVGWGLSNRMVVESGYSRRNEEWVKKESERIASELIKEGVCWPPEF